MRTFRRPAFRLWIEERPQTARKTRKSMRRYITHIKEVASKTIPKPTRSPRVDIEIFFVSQRTLRADVDNVIKPILNALQGIVYLDDSQIRSVKVTALPEGEAFGLSGWVEREVVERLLFKDKPREFLITIYEGIYTPAP